jgi:hypothetical protein
LLALAPILHFFGVLVFGVGLGVLALLPAAVVAVRRGLIAAAAPAPRATAPVGPRMATPG